MVADIPSFGSVSSALAVPRQPPAPRSSRNLLILDRWVTADVEIMYHHAGGPQVHGPQQMYLQGTPGSLPPGNDDPPAAGVTQMGPAWVQLKTYSAQPGPPYRGVRFNRVTNTWGAMVSYRGREVEISCHEHEEEAALAHDRRVLELFGAGSRVNFQYSGLVDRGTMQVLGLRSADGTEIPFRTGGGGGGGEQSLSGMSSSHTLPARLPSSPGGTTGVEDTPGAGRWDGERHVTPGRQLPRAPGMGVEGPREEPWAAAEGAAAARPDRGPPAAAAAADHASANVAKAGDHDDAGLVYEIAFPQPGALGLNLRTYLAEQPAGARLGLPPYGSLEVLDAQKFYLQAIVEPGDLLVAINGKKLTGSRFSFEDAIAVCSRASLPRVLRFARMKGASAAEIECAFGADVVCATFDAMDAPKQRLVTAQLHPSAPPHFFLNPPTRQGTKTPTAGTAAGGAEATAAIGASAPLQSPQSTTKQAATTPSTRPGSATTMMGIEGASAVATPAPVT